MRIHLWGRCLQKAAVAALAAIPVTVWAPNDLVKSDILEVTIEYRVLTSAVGSGRAKLTEAQAKHVTAFLNEQLLDRGIRFETKYMETHDAAADLSKKATKAAALGAVEKFARPGVITIVVPAQANHSAAYLGQPLETGPVALHGGKGGVVGIAQLVGNVFGFTKICSNPNNIMFANCPAVGAHAVDSLKWTYFTDDSVAQSFSQVLDLWKWDAQAYLVSRARPATRSTLAVSDLLSVDSTP